MVVLVVDPVVVDYLLYHHHQNIAVSFH